MDESQSVNEPHLPRQRKRPRRFEEGTSQGFYHDTPKDYYRQYYFEAIDVLVNCIQERFDQPGYKVYVRLESLLIKACKNEDFEEELKFVCDFYKEDLNESYLRAQLPTFVLHFQEVLGVFDKISIFDLKKYICSTSDCQIALIDEVKKVMQMILVHKDRTDSLCINTALNEFVDSSPNRSNIFAKYGIT